MPVTRKRSRYNRKTAPYKKNIQPSVKRYFKKAAATAAAGTLGYIVGNVPGAVAAAGLANTFIGKRKVYRKKSGKSGVRGKPISTVTDMNLVKMTIPGSGTKKPKGNIGARIQFTDTYSQVHVTDCGIQGVFTLRYHLHRNQLTRDYATATAENDRSISRQNIFDLDPNKNTTGGGVFGVFNPNNITDLTNDQMYVGTHYSTFSITSFSNVAAHCEIYFLLAKRDHDAEPKDTFSFMNQSYAGGQGVTVQPVTDANVPTPGYTQFEQYGVDPTWHPEFKKYWKVLAKKEFILQAGNTLRMEIKRKVNKLIKRNLITSQHMQRGLTYVPLLIVKPAPVLFRKTTDTAVPLVANTASHTIGVMFTDTTNYYPVKGKDSAINRAVIYNQKVPGPDATQIFVDSDDDKFKDVV